MALMLIPADPKLQEMALEVMRKVRRQTYTPERLCELQKIVETKYLYWWSNDMKKEEFNCELMTDEIEFYRFGSEVHRPNKEQARVAKWCNAPMETMHMGHQPLVWFMDDTHARGLFQYEDHMTYREDQETVNGWMFYLDDFVKCDDGVWRISALRMSYKKMNGMYRNPNPPDDWMPEEWDTM